MVNHSQGTSNWILKRGHEVLAYLIYEETDQPFFYFKFHPEPAYHSVQKLFSEEIRLMDKGSRGDKLVESYV